jgi:uncharacterized Zn finger protein
MKLFQEITEWPDSTPNHAYYMDDSKSKMVAYIRAGSKAVFKFKAPIRIDTRGRKFREIADTNNFTVEETTNPNRWEVTGSKGDLYIVRLEDGVYRCSCSGFKFRGDCRHVKEFAK